MAAPEEINADMLAFWNGKGGHTWVARQEHTDITLTPVTDASIGFAAPRAGGAGSGYISAAAAVRPHWSLRAPRPAAWWGRHFRADAG